MKKRLLSSVAIVLLFLIFSNNTLTNANNFYSKEVEKILTGDFDNVRIHETLMQYFTNEFEVLKNLELIPNNSIYPKSKLYDYNKTYQDVMVRWYKGINEQIDTYNLELTINKIEKEGNLLKVNVDKNVKMRYKSSDVDTIYRNNHIIYINGYMNDLYVEKDIFEENEAAAEVEKRIKEENNTYEDYLNGKTNILNTRNKSLSRDVKEYNDASKQVAENQKKEEKTYSKYKGDVAASWAINNIDIKEDYAGNDCTNFVSKALKAGGLPTDSTWKQGSNAWIRVKELRSWLINKGYADQYDWQHNSRKGDVVQLYSSGKKDWTHSTIITYINYMGKIYVSAHSDKYYNRPIFQYYPTSSYSNIRYLKITAY